MTRYPGRSTGIGERPPLPNVLPVPASLGTPITETTAVVSVTVFLIIHSLVYQEFALFFFFTYAGLLF